MKMKVALVIFSVLLTVASYATFNKKYPTRPVQPVIDDYKKYNYRYDRPRSAVPIHPVMNSSAMVTTTGDGVIVLIGNKLSKFDSDLKLISETEIEIDWQSWEKTISERLKISEDELKLNDNY